MSTTRCAKRFAGWTFVLCCCVVQAALAKDRADCEREYLPQFGQPGKDVAWEPTVEPLVDAMLKMANTTARDLVIDLGAGDGAIVIGAAKRFGAQAIGIEYNPELAKLAQCYVEAEGVSDKAKVIRGDIFEYDFSKATVLTLYLVPELNVRLRPIILEMRPGTRVVSHRHPMGDWKPDQQMEYEKDPAFLWIVPAKAQGAWTFKEQNGKDAFTLALTQQYQELGGNAQLNDGASSAVKGSLRGTALVLSFRGADGVERTLRGEVRQNQIAVTVSDGRGDRSYLGARLDSR